MKRWLIWPLAAQLLWLSACMGGAHQSAGVDPQQVNRVVGQVLSAQSRIGPDEKLDALLGLERYLTNTDSHSDQSARALEQLAGLYLEIELKSFERYTVLWQRSGQSGDAPRLSHDRSIPLYLMWLADYPQHPGANRVRYQLAHVYSDLGNLEMQRTMLQALLADDSDDHYHAEARYRLGEMAFEEGRFHRSAGQYEAVLAHRAPLPLRELAAYKLAWSYYLQPNDSEAVRAVLEFIDTKLVPRGSRQVLDSQSMPEPVWERVREMVTLLARAAQRQGGVSTLNRYLGKDRDYAHMVYRRLGEVSLQMGDPELAVAAYNGFIEDFPTARRAPMFVGYIVDAYSASQQPEQAVAARVRLVDEFGVGSAWWQAQSVPVQQRHLPVLRQTTHRLARYFHSQAQASHDPADFDRAATWYRRYLAKFPHGKQAGQAAFLLGEGLFEQGKYPQAAEAYLNAAYSVPAHGKADEAAYAAVYALERYLAQAAPDSAAYRERLMALPGPMTQLIRNYPRESRLPQAFERVSGLLFSAGEFDALYELADMLVRFGPRQRELHVLAWRALGEAAMETGRVERAEEAFTQALEYIRDDAPQRREIKKLLVALAVSRVGQAGTDATDAALERAVALLDRDDPLAESVRADRVLNRLAAQPDQDALNVLGAFLTDYPHSEHRERLAQTLLVSGERALTDDDAPRAERLWDGYRQWFKGEWPAWDRKLADLQGRAALGSGDLLAADRQFTRLLNSHPQGAAPEELVDRLAGIRFKRAAPLLAAGDPSGLALLESIVAKLPTSVLVPSALEGIVNAAGEHPQRALSAALQLLDDFPDSPQANGVWQRLATMYQAAGQLNDAADHLLVLASDEADDPAQRLTLRGVALFIEAGDPAAAVAALNTLLARFKPGSDRWVALRLQRLTLEITGTLVADHLDVVQQERLDTALLAVFTPLAAAGKLAAAGRKQAGTVWLQRAAHARQAFAEVALVPPLKVNLKAKKAALKVALGRYAKAAGFRSLEVTTEAHREMGDLFAEFGHAVLAAPVPAELTAAQVEIYRQGLEKRARPYLKRAVSVHERNLQQLREGVANVHVRASLAALARLKPEWYDRPEPEVVLIHEP